MREFRPGADSAHGREEELQWARLLSMGDAACGVALVFVQKLCTAFHEFAPAWEQGALSAGHLAYFRGRLAGRAVRALATLRNNGLGAIDGAAQLEAMVGAIEAAATMEELAALAEAVHALGHTLSEALEREAAARSGRVPAGP
jgi:hypothetical protein